MNMNNIYNISFMATPGGEVMRRITQECKDEARVTKFAELFQDTFSKNLDKNTVVDIDSREQFIFSHLKFPNIFYKSDQVLDRENGKNFLSAMIMACPKVLVSIEHEMIREIIRKSVESGVGFEDMIKLAESNIENENLKKYFLDNLNIARRIKEENPGSNLTFWEFDEMEMKIFDELAEIPGTPEYKIFHDKFTLTS